MNKKIEPELLPEEDLTQNYFIGVRTDLGIKFVYLGKKGIFLKNKIEEGIPVFKKGDEDSDTIYLAIKSKFAKAEKMPVLDFYNKDK